MAVKSRASSAVLGCSREALYRELEASVHGYSYTTCIWIQYKEERVSNVHYSLNKRSSESHVPGISITSVAVQYFSALLVGMVSRVHSANTSNMATVAVASQSAPPETCCRVDTAGPVLGINDLHRINLDVPGPSVRCLL